MTKEDKELLLKDLSARLPYGVKVFIKDTTGKYLAITERIFDTYVIQFFKNNNILIKPYLRPMTSMTEEEKEELNEVTVIVINYNEFEVCSTLFDEEGFDWLNAHHFDYRGLIEKGLALEAPEGMYKID